VAEAKQYIVNNWNYYFRSVVAQKISLVELEKGFGKYAGEVSSGRGKILVQVSDLGKK